MDMMERLTVGELNQFINVFYGKNGQAWVRGGGPGPEYEDCSLYDFIREIAPKHGVKVEQENEELDWQMCDMLADGPETKEGLIAFFYSAVVQAVEMRERLRMIEEVLCGDENKFDIDRLRELIQADREGRCFVLLVTPDPYAGEGEEQVIVCEDGEATPCNVIEATIGPDGNGEMNIVYDTDGPTFQIADIGKTVFLPHETDKIEAVLAKMKEAARE